MKLAVLSDVHANLPALEAVLEDLEPYSPDGVIVAGDFVGGPQPNETIEILSSLKGWMIRGNSDDHLLRYDTGQAPPEWQTSKQWALARWTYARIRPEHVQFLACLPSSRVVAPGDAHPIRVVHGSHRDPGESLFPQRDPAILDEVFASLAEPVFVCGHTHMAWKVAHDGRLALNPGAVCGPLDGYVGAEYALLTWEEGHWSAELRRVSYDIGLIRDAFHQSGLLQQGGALAKAFLRSIETGQNVARDFLTYAYKLASQAGFAGVEVVPDEIWDRAAESFAWRSGSQESR